MSVLESVGLHDFWQPPANSPSRVQAMEASARSPANNPSKQWRMQTTNLSPRYYHYHGFTSSLVSEHKVLTFNSKVGIIVQLWLGWGYQTLHLML